jgi:uncharacterized membrane protein
MVSGMVRQESWINEVLRINSCTDGITEVKFGYSQLYAISDVIQMSNLKSIYRGGFKCGICGLFS